MGENQPHDPRPRLVFRIGVTGHRPKEGRALPVEDMRAQSRAALLLIRAEIERIAAKPAIRAAYAPGTPHLILVSGLAEGADQIVAAEALDPEVGYALRAILPFPTEEYRQDFYKFQHEGGGAMHDAADKPVVDGEATAAALEAFDRLLAKASAGVLQLDGAHDGPGQENAGARSYDAAGRLVIQNCDLMLALWDGRPAGGLGGTGDIVRSAVRLATPVWWITPNGSRPPRLITTIADLRRAGTASNSASDEDRLKQQLRAQIRPPWLRASPDGGHPALTGPFHRLHSYLNARALRGGTPYDYFLSEAQRRAPRAAVAVFADWFGGRFRCFRDYLASPLPPGGPEPKIEGYYADLYRVPDARSVAISDLDRSSYLTIFLLGAFALSAAVVGVASGNGWMKFSTSVVELLAIVGILAVYLCARIHRWHDRWIDYRLLAELFRKQYFLSLVSWSLPTFSAREAVRFTSGKRHWVAWYFHACVRAATFTSTILDAEFVGQAHKRIVHDLAVHQSAYHERNSKIMARVNAKLWMLAELLFCISVGLVVLEVLLALLEVLKLADSNPCVRLVSVSLGVSLGVLPAFSAAFFAIRAQGEFDILAHRSTEMAEKLRQAGARVEQLRPGDVLASQDLGAEIYSTTTEMLADVKGWSAIFDVKDIEAA